MTQKSDLPNTGQSAFLAALSKCGNISDAARLAGVSRSMHYVWLEDDDYAVAFEAAYAEAADWLESEARRRAVEGVEEPVFHQGQPQRSAVFDDAGELVRNAAGEVVTRPVTVRKYSDKLLIELLHAAKPDKFRSNWKGEITTKRTGSADLSGLTEEELGTLETIARRLVKPA